VSLNITPEAFITGIEALLLANFSN